MRTNCFSGEGSGETRYAGTTRQCAGMSSDTQPGDPTWPHSSFSSDITGPLNFLVLTVTLESLSHCQVQDGRNASPTEPSVSHPAEKLHKHGGNKASLSLQV